MKKEKPRFRIGQEVFGLSPYRQPLWLGRITGCFYTYGNWYYNTEKVSGAPEMNLVPAEMEREEGFENLRGK